MTKDVIELAREAGFGSYADQAANLFRQYAALVAARERERLGDDVKRLDFLAAEYWSPNPSFHYGNISVNLALPTVEGLQSESLRDAIDAAIRALNTEGY